MPYFLKNLSVSIHGHYLDWLRYGGLYRSLLGRIKEREKWDLESLLKYQETSLLQLYRHAIENVPYYVEQVKHGIIPSEVKSIGDLSYLPILEKQDLIQQSGELVDRNKKKYLLKKIYTSGSTGTPVKIYNSRNDFQRKYAYHHMRVIRWGGVDLGTPYAMVGGQLIVPFKKNKPPFWVWNSGLNQLYMSSYHLSSDFSKYYLEELRRRKLNYIYGYPSSLYSLAYFAREFEYDDIRFNVAFANAEPLLIYQKNLIEEVFKCKTHEHYGSSEFVALASECREGNMHISPEAGIIEVLGENNKPVDNDQVGKLVCTGLLNYSMPLLRYNTGDVGSISIRTCDCGCAFPILEKVEGREDDLLITKDGRRIGRLDPVFKGDLGIKEAQIIQETIERITVKVVPSKNYTNERGGEIVKRLKERMGDINVEIILVNKIERTMRGKFKAVVNNIK